MKKMKWKSMVLWILFAFLCIGGIQADAANGDGEKDYTFPDSATLVYGEKFEDAVLNGGSGDGEFLIYDTDTWSHVTNNRDARMAAGDLGNRAEKYVGEVSGRYAVWFLPADGSEGRGQPITVTFLPKPVTVVINNVTRVYGDTVSYTYDEKNIKYAFDDDKTSGLGIKLSAVDEDGNPVTEKTPVGTYKIVGEATSGESRYYDITFQTGELTITPKEAELTWQGYENLTYNPEGKTNVTATVSNLLDGDTCNVTVENGSNVDAGEYTAKAVKLDNSNYQLPTSSGLTQSYTIEKATPDCADVTAALTYGQTLGEAKIQGAAADPTTKKSLPGSFRFEAEDTIPSVADSQTTKYAMKFYPEDAANYNEVSIDEYDMTVSRKSLKVQIMDREKTYGDAMSVEDLLSYDKSELVGEDKLVVTLTATNENGSEATLNPVYIDAGSYTVGASQNTLDSENPNYAITVKTGELTVQKRPVELEWSDVSNIIYQYVGGAENPTEWAKVGANVTASITNLVQQEDGTFDDCQVVVEDGNKTEPSKNGTSAATVYYAYAAELLGSASQNYTFAEKLPETPWKIADVYESSRLQPYVIREPGDCVFPAAMVMTYGESIGDARMLAGSGDGAFEIVDKDGQSVTDRKPSAGIYEEEYKVKFTPSDGSGVSYGTAMLIVKKAPLAVTADNVTKTYGEGKPEYTWKVTDGKLADGDDVKELLTVKSVAGESSGDEKTSEVNIYEIVLEKQINENYDLTFVGAKLTVEPREIEIVWSDTSNLVYGYVDGKKNLEQWKKIGANVTATAKGLVNDDTCNLTCQGGNETNAGKYWATVTGLDNPNYCLPSYENEAERQEKLMLRYEIRKADPEAVFPKKLKAYKGDKLGKLSFVAKADVPGTFSFEKGKTTLKKSGTYKMIFTPEDTRNYNTAEAMVKVTVSKQTAAGKGSAARKNTGGKGSSVKGASSGTVARNAGAAKTSDNSPVWLYSVLALSSLLAAVAVLRKKRH